MYHFTQNNNANELSYILVVYNNYLQCISRNIGKDNVF